MERERFIYSSSEQMLSAVGVWMQGWRGSAQGSEGVGWRRGRGGVVGVHLEKKFSNRTPAIAITPTSTHLSPFLLLLLLLSL